jgi:hypothetical protein
MRLPSVILAAVILVLSGCIPEQQRQVVNENASCMEAAYNSPEAAPLRAHQPFYPTDATLAQLVDRSLASEAEIASLTAVHPRLRACQIEFLSRLDRVAPTLSSLFARDYRDTDNDLVLLIDRKINWGEFTRRRRERAIAGQEAFIAEQRRFDLMQGLFAFYLLNQILQPVQPKTTLTTAIVTTCPQQDGAANCVQP